MDVIGNLTLIIAHSGIFHLVLHFPDKRMAVKGQEIVQDSKAIFKVHSVFHVCYLPCSWDNGF